MTDNRQHTDTIRDVATDPRYQQLLRVALLALAITSLIAVPAAAQIDDTSEAADSEGVDIIVSFVYFLMFFVPALALIIILVSFAVLMSTTDPQKKSNWKSIRNGAVLYGFILAPALGVIISLLSTLTGNPILEGIDI